MIGIFVSGVLKAIVITVLITIALIHYGVKDIAWLVVITCPVSFALYSWFGLFVREIDVDEEGDKE